MVHNTLSTSVVNMAEPIENRHNIVLHEERRHILLDREGWEANIVKSRLLTRLVQSTPWTNVV